MSHKVVFDSNVWRKVASPSKFEKDPAHETYKKIHAACLARTVQGYLSETTFTLEQIRRDDRLAWLKSGLQVAVTDRTVRPGMLIVSMTLMPSTTVLPGNVDMVREHLHDALGLGIKVLRSNRIALPQSPLLNNKAMYVSYASDEEFHTVNNQIGHICRDLEQLGVGIANIKDLGNARVSDDAGVHWTDGIASLAETDGNKRKVAEMVAEWADTDALATSIAHGATFFCTNDVGKGSTNKGVRSIMLPANVAAVSKRYGIHFVTPTDLVTSLSL